MSTASRNFLLEVDKLSQKINPVNLLVNKIISLILPKTTALAHVTCVPGNCSYTGDWDCGATCFWTGNYQGETACFMTGYVIRYYLCPPNQMKTCKECHSCDCGGCQIYHFGPC